MGDVPVIAGAVGAASAGPLDRYPCSAGRDYRAFSQQVLAPGHRRHGCHLVSRSSAGDQVLPRQRYLAMKIIKYVKGPL